MKNVMISIKPKWCELIGTGEKTIEVRKTKPKCEVPFKCYIYCTQPKYKHEDFITVDAGTEKARAFYGGGKVIGEFICYTILQVDCDSYAPFNRENGDYIHKLCCLNRNEFWEYTHGRCAYGWHISDLVIYDKPKELGEFGMKRPPQSWCYVE